MLTDYEPLCSCPGELNKCLVKGDHFVYSLENMNGDLTNKEKRFLLYKVAANILGYKQRQSLPNCVVAFIRDHLE